MSISKDALQELKERSHLPQVFPQRLSLSLFLQLFCIHFYPFKISFQFLISTSIPNYDSQIYGISNGQERIIKASLLFHICKSQDLQEEPDFSPGTVPSTLVNQR